MRCAMCWGRAALVGAVLVATAASAGATEPGAEAARGFDALLLGPAWHWAQDPPPDAAAPREAPLDLASGLGIILNKARELSTERWEIRSTVYVWFARIDKMESKASSDDMRAARALGYVDHTHVTTRDFDHDFGFDLHDPLLILNPEILSRWGPSVLRLSWWMWSDDSLAVLPNRIAYGDRTYEEGSTVEGDGSLMDSKLIYEYRVAFEKKFQAFVGVGFHFIATFGEFTYSSAWGWNDNGHSLGGGTDASGNPVNPPPNPGTPFFRNETETQFPGAPLVTVSFRSEWEPVEMLFLTVDTQSMYLPKVGGGAGVGYGYTDTKTGLWVQASEFVRIGVGARLWYLWVEVSGLDKHETEFEGRFELHGGWGALTIMFP